MFVDNATDFDHNQSVYKIVQEIARVLQVNSDSSLGTRSLRSYILSTIFSNTLSRNIRKYLQKMLKRMGSPTLPCRLQEVYSVHEYSKCNMDTRIVFRNLKKNCGPQKMIFSLNPKQPL